MSPRIPTEKPKPIPPPERMSTLEESFHRSSIKSYVESPDFKKAIEEYVEREKGKK